ncbi:MAG: M23 family metallopeptidase [Chloroflexota bacterium]|nr:M23 family metallopeptidase [Chloroflexota bacterium]
MPKMGMHCRKLCLMLAFLLACPLIAAQDAAVAGHQVRLTAPTSADIEPVEHNVLHRPIQLLEGYAHWIDRSYAYGGNAMNSRPVHLGVEFVNARATPVFAAKAGRVVFAGDDTETQLGPQLDYYGNVVVLAHDIRSLRGRRIYTLYGHLEAVDVKLGQVVEDLARLGSVGSSGVAIGPHLHFEVRVGDPFDFRQTRNPELWLQHYIDRGLIAGSLRNQDGEPIYGRRLTVRSDTVSRDVFTYGGEVVSGDPVWRESFVLADLHPDEYEILVLNERGLPVFRDSVQVKAYRTTFVEIVLDE